MLRASAPGPGKRVERQLDASRSEDELWGDEVLPLGLGPLLNVDTSEPVDVKTLASRIRALVVG